MGYKTFRPSYVFATSFIQRLLNRVKLGSNQVEISQRAQVFEHCVKFIQIIWWNVYENLTVPPW